MKNVERVAGQYIVPLALFLPAALMTYFAYQGMWDPRFGVEPPENMGWKNYLRAPQTIALLLGVVLTLVTRSAKPFIAVMIGATLNLPWLSYMAAEAESNPESAWFGGLEILAFPGMIAIYVIAFVLMGVVAMMQFDFRRSNRKKLQPSGSRFLFANPDGTIPYPDQNGGTADESERRG